MKRIITRHLDIGILTFKMAGRYCQRGSWELTARRAFDVPPVDSTAFPHERGIDHAYRASLFNDRLLM